MTVSGVPYKNGDNHVKEIAKMAINLVSSVKHFKMKHLPERKLMVRAGIHSGKITSK